MKQKITYWKEPDGKYLGYLNEYPDHWTQGEDLEDLIEHLQDLYREFSQASQNGLVGITTTRRCRNGVEQ